MKSTQYDLISEKELEPNGRLKTYFWVCNIGFVVVPPKPEDICKDTKGAGGDKAEPTTQKSQTHLPGHG